MKNHVRRVSIRRSDMPPTSISEKPGSRKSAPAQDPKEVLKLEAQRQGGANFFFWLAALSFGNTLLWLFHANSLFLVGLTVSQLIDGLAVRFETQTGVPYRAIGFFLSAFIAAGFVALGTLARRGSSLAFVIGLSLYAIDSLLLIMLAMFVQAPVDILTLGLRLFMLLGIGGGLRASKMLNRLGQ